MGANATDVQVLHIARAEGRALRRKTPRRASSATSRRRAACGVALLPGAGRRQRGLLPPALPCRQLHPGRRRQPTVGAFASHVPYGRMWIRVEQDAFQRDPMQLIARLRAISRRSSNGEQGAQVRGGCPYDQATVVAPSIAWPPASPTTCCAPRLGMPSWRYLSGITRSHKYAADDKWGLNCSCTGARPDSSGARTTLQEHRRDHRSGRG